MSSKMDKMCLNVAGQASIFERALIRRQVRTERNSMLKTEWRKLLYKSYGSM